MQGDSQRVVGETSKAYAAYVCYRDLGESRSLQRVSNELQKSMTVIKNWSVRYEWVERVRRWEEEQDRARRAADIKAIERMTERHAQIAMGVQKKVVDRLNKIDPAELSPGDLIHWFEISVKVERQAHGLSESKTSRVEISGPDGAPLEVANDADRAARILRVLEEVGVLQSTIGIARDAEDDTVHQAGADGEASSLPAATP